MAESNMERRNLFFKKEQLDDLEYFGKITGLTFSELIRRSIDNYISILEERHQLPERKKKEG